MRRPEHVNDGAARCVCADCSALATVCRECVRAIALRWWGGIARHPADGPRRCKLCELGHPAYCGECFVEAVAEQRDVLRAAGVEIGEPRLPLGGGPA